MADDAPKPVEAEATYQGIPCLSAEFAATPGGSPNTGTVVVAARSMTALKIQVGRALFSDRPFPSVSTIPRNPPLDYPVSAMELADGVIENGTLQPFGELVLRSTVGELRVQRLMPIDVEPIDQDDDGMVLYRIRLADVRTIWPHRGVLFGDYNHYQADGSPVPHVPQRRLSFTLKWCGAALPGVAKLELAPKAAEVARKTEMRGVSWRFDRPDVKLDDQLKTQDLHQVLLPDGETIVVYARGEGKDSPKSLGIPAEMMRVIAAPAMTLVPDSVLIVGAPRQKEQWLALGPESMVGLAAYGEELLPWVDALATYGLEPADAERWILQKPETQEWMLRVGVDGEKLLAFIDKRIGEAKAALKQAREDKVHQLVIEQIEDTANALVDERNALEKAILNDALFIGKELAERLRSWLYRWFRLPAEWTHSLPMLDLVDSVTKEVTPPKVWVDQFSEFLDDIEEDAAAAGGGGGATLSARDIGILVSSPFSFGARQRIRAARAGLLGETPESFDHAGADAGAGTATRRKWGTNSAGDIDPRQVKMDRDRGVIRIDTEEPPGVMLTPSVATLEQGRLGAPTAIVKYRYEVKNGRIRAGEISDPSAPYAAAPDDHFTLALERHGADAREVPLDRLRSTPRVVKNPDLVVLERINGSSNEQDVRRIAFEQAAAHFGAPSVVQTWTVDAVGIHPVWPDGAVGQVSFRVNDKKATTKVVINSYRLSAGMAPTYSQKRVLETVARNAAASEPVIAAAVSSRRAGR